MKFSGRIIAAVILATCIVGGASAQNKYVGASTCKMCHQTAKQGEQFKIWEKSAHAGAYKTLTTPAAQKIRKGAEKDAECLACHTTGAGMDAKMFDKKFKAEDGVQCESCHGAGEKYKAMGTMKDHAKAVAAGLMDFKDEAAIEAHCRTCHNEKSPVFKGFEFKEMWAKIAHPQPKG